MQIKRKVVPFEAKASDEGPHGSFSGYAACTKNLDAYGDIIAPGAFAMDLQKFLDEGFIGGLNHDWDRPIGRPKAASEDGRGLFASAELIDTPHAAECRVYMNSGICRKLSIGFRTLGRIYMDRPEDVKRWWDEHGHAPSEDEIDRSKYGATILTRVKLLEFSPVLIPANDSCDITQSKSSKGVPRGRLSFDDHFLAAHGTVEEFAERIESYLDRKDQDARPAAPQRRTQLARLIDRLNGLKSRMDRPTPAEAEAMQLAASALALELDL